MHDVRKRARPRTVQDASKVPGTNHRHQSFVYPARRKYGPGTGIGLGGGEGSGALFTNDNSKMEQQKHKHQHLLSRYWELINLYPEIDDPELARRIEEFTMNAPPEQLLRVQKAVFEAAAEYMADDPGFKEIMEHLEGKRVGLAIGREYQTTVTLARGVFEIETGIKGKQIPVLSVASRADYVDALLRRKDILRMLVTRKITATHKITLARWGFSIFDRLHDDHLFDEVLSKQSVAEQIISRVLQSMEY